MDLPSHSKLDISSLSASFRNVTNSYKFYWFWAILDSLSETSQPYIGYRELSIRMLALAWYPLDYFKLTFGKQDSFKMLALNISENLTVDNSLTSKPLFDQINKNLKPERAEILAKQITDILKRYVSYRFLTPFHKVSYVDFQNEFRIVTNLAETKPFMLTIGSIENIAFEIESTKLLDIQLKFES